jgi:hypothetical protein
MESLETNILTETVEQFCSRLWDYKLNDCAWSKAQQRSYLDALLSDECDSDNLTHFSAFERDGEDCTYIVDGNNRSVTLLQYMNGADRLYWRVGKDKVVYCCHGELKRGYRLMTGDECDKFLDTIVTLNVDQYVDREPCSRKRSREDESSNDSSKSSKTE